MSSFDFFLAPAQAAAFRAVGLLSAPHACHLAMKWLEAGSESVAVAAMAIEDGSYVGWADVSLIFREAMEESGVKALTKEEEHALRMHALLGAFLNREVAAGDLWDLGIRLPSLNDSNGFGLSDVCSEQLFCLALEFNEIMNGEVFTGRKLSVVSADLNLETDRLRREIEEIWPVCLPGPDSSPQ